MLGRVDKKLKRDTSIFGLRYFLIILAAMLQQLFKLLFDYDIFLARVPRNCLNKQTEFLIFFHCYA